MLYQMGAASLARRMMISRAEADELFERYFQQFSLVESWVSTVKAVGRARGYVTTPFGRKVTVWELQSPNPAIRAKGDRLLVNAPIQGGCLPADTRVLTRDGGWVPIGDFTDLSEVWTGSAWAPAVRLEMGSAERVRVHLSDGRTFDCDNRHKFLTYEDGFAWPQWCHIDSVEGRELVRDPSADWGAADRHSVEDWYWVGRMTGDGCLYRHGPDSDYLRWKLSFNQTTKSEASERFQDWVLSKDWSTAHSQTGFSTSTGPGDAAQVSGMTPAGLEFWKSFGFRPGKKGCSTIPPEVFTLDRTRREAFFQGRMGADGNVRADGSSRIVSSVRSELEDLLRLGQTLGRTGSIGKEQVLKGRGVGGSDHRFWTLGWHAQPRPLVVDRVERLGTQEMMYTLSVDHPLHAFSSEGLISKNSADYMKIAMVRAAAALRKAGLWGNGVMLTMNQHDSLTFEVHNSVDMNALRTMLQEAVVFPVKGFPAMKADWEFGKRWGSGISWALDETLEQTGGVWHRVGEAPEDTTVRSEIVSAGLEDSDPGSDPTDVVAFETAPPVPAGERGPRELCVEMRTMPTHSELEALTSLVASRPGEYLLQVRCPEGTIRTSIRHGLSLSDEAAVSAAVGGAVLRWDEASVDISELSKVVDF